MCHVHWTIAGLWLKVVFLSKVFWLSLYIHESPLYRYAELQTDLWQNSVSAVSRSNSSWSIIPIALYKLMSIYLFQIDGLDEKKCEFLMNLENISDFYLGLILFIAALLTISTCLIFIVKLLHSLLQVSFFLISIFIIFISRVQSVSYSLQNFYNHYLRYLSFS